MGYAIEPGASVGGYQPGATMPGSVATNAAGQALDAAREQNEALRASGQQQIAAAQNAAELRVEQARQQLENESAQAEQSLVAWQDQLNASLANYELQLRQARRQTTNPYTYGPGGA